MIKRLGKILNPERYHGTNRKKSFFEGWYYKMVSADKMNSFAVIPGVFLDKDHSKSISFIQVLDGKNKTSHFIDFPIDLFKASENKLELDIGGNRFNSDSIEISMQRNELSFKANLSFSNIKTWPKTILSPGIMGWYSWVPFMECFHGVLSLDHSIDGIISINEREVNFSGGKGYIEKDWGTAFPEAWFWQQSNHFDEDEVSLTASIAIIPWIGKSFPGFIIGFLWDGTLYRFATYTGAKTKTLDINEKDILWIVEDKKYILEMRSERGTSSPLRAPALTGMDRQIDESINSWIDVKLYQKIKTGKTMIYQGEGNNAGMEIEGNIPRLLNMIENA